MRHITFLALLLMAPLLATAFQASHSSHDTSPFYATDHQHKTHTELSLQDERPNEQPFTVSRDEDQFTDDADNKSDGMQEGKGSFSIRLVHNLHYIHGALLFLVWGLIADLAIMIARYAKNYPNYTEVHGNIMNFVVISTFVSEVFIIWLGVAEPGNESNTRAKSHLILGLIVLTLCFIQASAGIVTRGKLRKNVYFGSIRKLTLLHKRLGYGILLATKVQMLIGCMIIGWYLVSILTGVYVLIAIIWVLRERRYRIELVMKNNMTTVEPQKMATDLQKRLVKLLNQVCESKVKSPGSEDIATILDRLDEDIKSINWVLLDDKIYDITNLKHPGGDFIINAIRGREIGRFFYGAYGIEIFEDKSHTHSARAAKLLASMCIGEVKPMVKLITAAPYDPQAYQDDSSSYNSDHTKYLDLGPEKELSSNLQQPIINRLNDQAEVWRLKSSQQLDKHNSKFFFESPGKFQLNQSYQGVLQLGRYFKISHSTMRTWRLYTTVLSQTPGNIKLREEIIEYYKNCTFGNKDFTFNPKWYPFTDELPFIVKHYHNPTAFSNFLHTQSYDGMRGFSISGPYGFGLEMFDRLSGHHIIFCAGTGILPFLDLFDVVLRKLIFDILEERIGPDAVKPLIPYVRDFIELIEEDFKITLFASIVNTEDFYGRDILENLQELTHSTNQRMFSQNLSFGKKSLMENIMQGNKRFNEDFVMNNLDMKAERVYICGPPVFNHDLPKIIQQTGFDKSRIILV